MPSVTRGQSYSLPSVSGIQQGVCGASVSNPSPSWVAELGELKKLVKRQQDQLSQLPSLSTVGACAGSGVVRGEGSPWSRLISTFPSIEVLIGGIQVPGLLDTGSMVSIRESFFLGSRLTHGVRLVSSLAIGCNFRLLMDLLCHIWDIWSWMQSWVAR